MDGTDNFETRFLINDACVKSQTPWMYGAAVGSYGLTMTIVPGNSPCLRCVLEALPDPGLGPTCDTAGVIMPIVTAIASIQAAEALKLLTGQMDKLHRSLITIDLWDFQFNRLDLRFDRVPIARPAIGNFEFLRGPGVRALHSGRTPSRLDGRGGRMISRRSPRVWSQPAKLLSTTFCCAFG
jgi:adenylyltransferase/sulfurtransferase